MDLHLQSREEMLRLLKYYLQKAQVRMKNQADKHRSDKQFVIGDLVYLKLQLYRQNSLVHRQFHKLVPRYFGPYKALDKVRAITYKLDLPA